MGLSAKALILITAYQYGITPPESLEHYLDNIFFPLAIERIIDTIIRNDYGEEMLKNEKIVKFLKKYDLYDRIVDNIKNAQLAYYYPFDEDFIGLLERVIDAFESPNLTKKILAADEVIHYEHLTGNMLDENMLEEYAFAERIVNKLVT